jgi:hypothetical protein
MTTFFSSFYFVVVSIDDFDFRIRFLHLFNCEFLYLLLQVFRICFGFGAVFVFVKQPSSSNYCFRKPFNTIDLSTKIYIYYENKHIYNYKYKCYEIKARQQTIFQNATKKNRNCCHVLTQLCVCVLFVEPVRYKLVLVLVDHQHGPIHRALVNVVFFFFLKVSNVSDFLFVMRCFQHLFIHYRCHTLILYCIIMICV